MPEPISHAEMIAAVKRQITYWSAESEGLGIGLSKEQSAHDLRMLCAVLVHLERTRPRKPETPTSFICQQCHKEVWPGDGSECIPPSPETPR